MSFILPAIRLIRNNLIIHEMVHVLVVIPFAFLIWKKTKDKKQVLILMIAAIFIDLDHIIDCFSFYGFGCTLSDFTGGAYFEITKKAYLPFHAWEWVIMFGVLAKMKGWKSSYAAIVLGMTPHLVFDAIIWDQALLYSITYRISNGFTVL